MVVGQLGTAVLVTATAMIISVRLSRGAACAFASTVFSPRTEIAKGSAILAILVKKCKAKRTAAATKI